MDNLLSVALKHNPFSNPFQKVNCEGSRSKNVSRSSSSVNNGPPNPTYNSHLVPTRNIGFAAASNREVKYGSNEYFLLCAFGGVLSCGLTHTMIVPLDMVKCRMQVDHVKYPSIGTGFKVTLKEDGVKGLVRGWAPTLFGYSIQGFCKFGFYELFKHVYADALGEENAFLYRVWVYLAASASAEFIADVGLSPFESIKVRIQTMPEYTSRMRDAIPKIMEKEGINGFYKSLVPLWGRQIPYTMMKFASFEKTVELLYKYVVRKPRDQLTKADQLVVTFASGYIAGVFCAVVSHPADTMVSKLQTKGATIGSVMNQIGFGGLWKGLVARIIMVGTLTAAQWFIYDGVKVALAIPRPPPPEMPESLKRKLAGR